MEMVFHGAGQDYLEAGFTENTITLGLDICTQNIKITNGSDIHGASQDYLKTGFAENMNTLGLNIYTQNMRITYENDFPWGQIKITRILDLQKITLRWASIFAPRSKRLRIKFVYPVGTIKITQNLDSREIILHGASIFVVKAWGLHMKMIFHGNRSRLLKIWTRRKNDYIIPQYFYPEHEGYTWK